MLTSIRSRLLVLVVTIIAIAVTLTVCLAAWSEARRYSTTKRDELFGTAEVIAAAAARGVVDNDTREVYQALRAIGRIRTLVYAGLTATDGRQLAVLGAAERLASDLVLSSRTEPVPISALVRSRTLEIQTPVVFEGREVGWLTVVADTSDFALQLLSTVAATLFAGAIALAAAVGIALRLQSAITRPLVTLTEAVARIGATHDYSIRLESGAAGEIGVLVDGFNRMIGEIRTRDNHLKAHHARLERDVAERTADYLAAADQARRAEAAKAEFLATMSHEIRTPLNGILVMAEVLATGDLPEAERRQASTIARSGASLLSIVNDILDVSKIEAGRLEVERLAVDPVETVETVLALFADRARGKGLALSGAVDLPEGTRVAADPTRLGQVLANLVNNALKFTEAGRVEIRVSPAGADRIRFAVSDTGIGIAADRLVTIFDAFTQADASTTRQFGGTGLGLTIARRLVEAQGGEIDVESRVGRGTTFRFDLPLADRALEVEPAGRGAVPASAGPDLSGLRILVADDVEVNREVAAAALQRLGLAATFVADGRQALTAVLAGRFDLVLMDGSMPEMDGFEAARRIRAHEAETGAARTPIVALTAHVVGTAAEAWRDAGMDGVLHKPFTLASLAAAIAAHARRGDGGRSEAPILAPEAAVPAGAPEAEVLDSRALDDLLATASGAMAVVDRIVGLYRSQSAAAVAAIAQAVERDDAGAAAQLAHALKSMSLNVGARAVAGLAQEIERRGRVDRAVVDAGTIARLAAAQDATLARLDAWRRDRDPGPGGETARA